MKSYLNTYNDETVVLVQSIIVDGITQLIKCDATLYACDLHNELFNTTEHFIYYSDAIAFCDAFGTFDAIEKVVNYEKDTFGESTIDVTNPCKIANMLIYIIGEEVMNEDNFMRGFWDENIGFLELTEILEEFQATI